MLLFLLLTGGIFACRSGSGEGDPSAEPQPLYANFFVRYLELERTLKAQASFRTGDSLATARPVAVEGGIAFQGSGMEQRELGQDLIRYHYQRSGDYRPPYTFRFTDPGGVRREYTIDLKPVAGFRVTPRISRSGGGAFSLSDGALEAGESLVVLITDARNQAASVTIEGPAAQQEHRIPSAPLAPLTPGRGQVYLVRKKTTQLQEGRLTVLLEGEFYSETLDIEILP